MLYFEHVQLFLLFFISSGMLGDEYGKKPSPGSFLSDKIKLFRALNEACATFLE